MDHFFNRGFSGHRQGVDLRERIPPGQHLVRDFPVLSAGPTPRISLDSWSFTLDGLVAAPVTWTWDQLMTLPAEQITVDINCVTTWSKLDTHWTGVSLDTLFQQATLDPAAHFLMASSYGGYTTNLPLDEVRGGKAWIAYRYDDQPLAPEHGGPARLLVPHLYLWKSAKWVNGIRLMAQDHPGFWESLGYNNHGDPWKEERYAGD